MLHFEGKIWHLVRAFTNWQKVDLKKWTWPDLGVIRPVRPGNPWLRAWVMQIHYSKGLFTTNVLCCMHCGGTALIKHWISWDCSVSHLA